MCFYFFLIEKHETLLSSKNQFFSCWDFFVSVQNVVTDGDEVTRLLTRDEDFNFRAVHWADLHGLLYNDLPPEIFLWGHLYLSFCVSEDKTSVIVKSKCLQNDEVIEISGDLLVAADGCLSSIRRTFLPDLTLRFVAV